MSRYTADDYEPPPMPVDDLPLFERSLPSAPGSDTSREAADQMHAGTALLRRKVLACYRLVGDRGLTPDECATLLGRSVLAIRPRCTELKDSGFLELTGERRENSSGLKPNVLRSVK